MTNIQVLSWIGKLVLAAIVLSGCGEAYRDEALLYANAAKDSLAKNEECEEADQCSRKNRVFFESGNAVIPFKKQVFVNIYDIKSVELADLVVKDISQVRESVSGPPFTVTFYSSAHGENIEKLKEVSVTASVD